MTPNELTVSENGAESSATDAEGKETAPRAASPLRRLWAGWPGRALRLVFMVLPLAWLSGKTEWSRVLDRITQVGPVAMLLGFLAMFMSVAAGAVRWMVLLRAFGAARESIPPYLTMLRYNLVGFYYAVLPTGLAGDAVRGLRVTHCFPKASDSFVVLFVERLCGLIALLAIFSIAAAVVPVQSPGLLLFALEVGVALALAFALASIGLPFVMQRAPGLRARVERIPVLGSFLANMPVPKSPSLFGIALALSLVCQYCVVVAVWLMIAPLAPAATLGACSRLVPPIVLVTFVPLTPGGLGQREVAFVKFFALVGVAAEVATATSLLLFTQMIVLAIIGGALVFGERMRSRAS